MKCSCRLFQHSMTIRISQSEVNQLYILTVSRHHDVLWFQITVHNTFAVDIANGICQFIGHSPSFFQAVLPQQPLLQGRPIHILHHDAHSQTLHLLQSDWCHHMRMLQQHQYLQFLTQSLAQGFPFAIRLFSFALQQPPSSIPFPFCHDVYFGCAQYLHIRKLAADSLERIHDIARGRRIVIVLLHGAKIHFSNDLSPQRHSFSEK